jgi:dipeptidase E
MKHNILLASVAGSFAQKLTTELTEAGTAVGELKTVFITTAANLYKDKPWMEQDITKFEQAGFALEKADVTQQSAQEMVELLKKTELLIMGGGNTVYLLEELHKKQLLRIIADRVAEGLIYVGSSAGAVIASPDVQLERYFDDRAQPPQLSSYAGLGLCEFHVLPHWGNADFKREYMKMLEYGYEQNIPLVSLTDEQALIGDGKSWEFLKSQ